jgi:hypothetical protein
MAVDSQTYVLHGLTIRSELTLDEPTVDVRPHDVLLRRGEPREVPQDVPEGELVAELVRNGRRGYTVVRDKDGVLVRFGGLAEFHIGIDDGTITSYSPASTDNRILSILATGTVLSVYLTMNGLCVLHAAAVEVENRAVVFTGLSGMGKSTCAAMACATGAKLIADDALVVELADEPRVLPGASHIRLRKKASSILDDFSPRPPSWETVDGRVAVAPARFTESAVTAALVVPRPSREARELQLKRIRGSRALPLLLAFARVPVWKDRRVVQRQFRNLAALADRLPVIEATVPWGPPFDVKPVKDLLAVVGGTTAGQHLME